MIYYFDYGIGYQELPKILPIYFFDDIISRFSFKRERHHYLAAKEIVINRVFHIFHIWPKSFHVIRDISVIKDEVHKYYQFVLQFLWLHLILLGYQHGQVNISVRAYFYVSYRRRQQWSNHEIHDR